MSDPVLFVGPVERVLFLRTVAVFQDLAPELLAAIAQHTREHFFPNGTRVRERDGKPDRVLLVVEGELVVDDGVDLRERVGPGEAVGLLSRLARESRPVAVWAESDTLALELDWDAHLDVCEEHFPVLLQYVRHLSRELLAEEGSGPSGGEARAEGREEARAGAGPTQEAGFGSGGHIDRPPLDRVGRVLRLGSAPAFRRASPDALFELAGHVTQTHWSAGQSVWQAGDLADHFFLILEGAARIDSGRSHGRLRRAPRTLGLEEALAGGLRRTRAVAAEPLAALRVEVEPFLDILEDHFDTALGLTAELAGRLLGHPGTGDSEP